MGLADGRGTHPEKQEQEQEQLPIRLYVLHQLAAALPLPTLYRLLPSPNARVDLGRTP